MTLRDMTNALYTRIEAIDAAYAADPQDSAACDAAAALGTAILPMVNGVPWWFADPPLDSVDPGGAVLSSGTYVRPVEQHGVDVPQRQGRR